MKNLKSKAVNIKGKKYVLVSDRVLAFNEEYSNGYIKTKLISQPQEDRIVIKAFVYPDAKTPERVFTGYAQEVIGDGYINKTSALENAETSAVGRALAMMGIGVIDSIASVDEITKAENRTKSNYDGLKKSDKICDICKAQAVIHPTKKTEFCPNWATHKKEGKQSILINKNDESFMDSLEEK